MKKQTKQTKKQTPSTPAKKMVKVTDVQLRASAPSAHPVGLS